MKKIMAEITLALISYLRMVVVVGSLVMWAERNAGLFVVCLLLFWLTTQIINKAFWAVATSSHEWREEMHPTAEGDI